MIPGKTLQQATWQIVAADASMSLDNVLAVAGAAVEHGCWRSALCCRIALMGAAASFVAALLKKHRWIAYVGLVIIAYVAVSMIVNGGNNMAEVLSSAGLI